MTLLRPPLPWSLKDPPPEPCNHEDNDALPPNPPTISKQREIPELNSSDGTLFLLLVFLPLFSFLPFFRLPPLLLLLLLLLRRRSYLGNTDN